MTALAAVEDPALAQLDDLSLERKASLESKAVCFD